MFTHKEFEMNTKCVSNVSLKSELLPHLQTVQT